MRSTDCGTIADGLRRILVRLSLCKVTSIYCHHGINSSLVLQYAILCNAYSASVGLTS